SQHADHVAVGVVVVVKQDDVVRRLSLLLLFVLFLDALRRARPNDCFGHGLVLHMVPGSWPLRSRAHPRAGPTAPPTNLARAIQSGGGESPCHLVIPCRSARSTPA